MGTCIIDINQYLKTYIGIIEGQVSIGYYLSEYIEINIVKHQLLLA